jgi:hypothetical protein
MTTYDTTGSPTTRRSATGGRAAASPTGRRHRAPSDPAAPRYPQVRVRLGGGDGPAGILIGKVAVALRYRIGDQAADTFNTAAHACTTREQLLRLIRATVRAR